MRVPVLLGRRRKPNARSSTTPRRIHTDQRGRPGPPPPGAPGVGRPPPWRPFGGRPFGPEESPFVPRPLGGGGGGGGGRLLMACHATARTPSSGTQVARSWGQPSTSRLPSAGTFSSREPALLPLRVRRPGDL